MTYQSPTAIALVAASMAACTPGLAKTTAVEPPLDCALTAIPQGAMTLWQAVVTAETAVSGSYDLRLASGGATIEQGGDFVAAGGDRHLLGEVLLSSAAAPRTATLSLTIGGQTYICPTR